MYDKYLHALISEPIRCLKRGGLYRHETDRFGLSANEACVVCGGGMPECMLSTHVASERSTAGLLKV